MISIELKEDGITRGLADLQRLLSDLSPVMNEIGQYLVETTKQRLEQGVTPEGVAFAPRSAATLARYARQGKKPKGGPLRLTDDMRQSSLHHSYGADFAEWGSSAIQSAMMQFGAPQGAFGAAIGKDKLGRDHFHSIPWGNIPARPFLGVSDTDEAGILDIVGEWLERAGASQT